MEVRTYQISVTSLLWSTCNGRNLQEVGERTSDGWGGAIVEGVDDIGLQSTKSDDLGENDRSLRVLGAVGSKVVQSSIEFVILAVVMRQDPP